MAPRLPPSWDPAPLRRGSRSATASAREWQASAPDPGRTLVAADCRGSGSGLLGAGLPRPRRAPRRDVASQPRGRRRARRDQVSGGIWRLEREDGEEHLFRLEDGETERVDIPRLVAPGSPEDTPTPEGAST